MPPAAPLKLRRLIDEAETVVLEAETANAIREQLEELLQRGRNDLVGLKDKTAKAHKQQPGKNLKRRRSWLSW